MRVVIIGTGNVAHVLGRLIVAAGHTIAGVYARDKEKAAALARLLSAGDSGDIKSSMAKADLCILSVSDKAIPEAISGLQLNGRFLVHTAGSVSKEVLRSVTPNYGVLYPLQSLRKECKEIPVIPFQVDANTPDDLTLLEDFAKSLSPLVYKATDEQRMRSHVAAVVVSNFPNYLYMLAEEYCLKNGIPFQLLQPLIENVGQRLQDGSPVSFQTGPAIRYDQETIQKHLSLLEEGSPLKSLYATLTEGIQAFDRKNK